MKPIVLLLVLGAAGLAGCTTPFKSPPDVASIRLERASSPVVIVEKIWLERKAGPLVVKGYVLKRLQADDTTQTHLDVVLYDGSGRVLRSSEQSFEPRQLPHRHRPPSFGTYTVPLDPLPPDTAVIQVQAHEGSHTWKG